MIDGFLHFLQRAGHFLSRMNEQFFFHLDVETNVSWAIILIMVGLYKLVEKYFNDQKLTSDELLQLLLVYILVLLVIIASYTDLRRLLNDPNRESSFIMFVVLVLMLVFIIGRLGVSTDPARKKRWLIVTLYLPILWIILTNGRVLEERMNSVRGLLPRSNATFVALPGEMMDLEVGGAVSESQRRRVQSLINSHPEVIESGVAGRKDVDGLVKLMGVVVLEDPRADSPDLERDIIDFVSDRIRDEAEIEVRPIESVEVAEPGFRFPAPNGSRFESYEITLRQHRTVEKALVEEQWSERRGRNVLVGIVELKPGFADLEPGKIRDLTDQIRTFANGEASRVRLSEFLVPRWIKSVAPDELPKTSDNQIDFEKLQKGQRNWSRLFRALDVRTPDDEESL
ncbi:MAG: hypothetical protein ACLFQQ_14035 [Desulfococcaceae bacterium]